MIFTTSLSIKKDENSGLLKFEVGYFNNKYNELIINDVRMIG